MRDNTEDLMTVEEVAALLRMHEDSVRRALRRGPIPGVRFGKHWWIRRSELEALLDTRQHDREGPMPEPQAP